MAHRIETISKKLECIAVLHHDDFKKQESSYCLFICGKFEILYVRHTQPIAFAIRSKVHRACLTLFCNPGYCICIFPYCNFIIREIYLPLLPIRFHLTLTLLYVPKIAQLERVKWLFSYLCQ